MGQAKTLRVHFDTFPPSPPFTPMLISQGSENPGFLKKPSPLGILGFSGFWALLVFSDIFNLNKQMGIFLVDLADQLSFYLDSSVL